MTDIKNLRTRVNNPQVILAADGIDEEDNLGYSLPSDVKPLLGINNFSVTGLSSPRVFSLPDQGGAIALTSSNITGTASNVTGIVSPANGGTGINNGTKTITLGGNLTTSGAFPLSIATTGNTNVTLPTSGTLAVTNNSTFTGTANFENINTSGTITGSVSVSNLSGVVSPANGGTGVNNGTKTITLGDNLTTSGAFLLTLNTTANTSVTLPTSGTLAVTNNSTFTGTSNFENLTATGTITLAPQNANLIFSSPASGSAAAPTFRSLVSDDIPAIASSKLTDKGQSGGVATLGETGKIPQSQLTIVGTTNRIDVNSTTNAIDLATVTQTDTNGTAGINFVQSIAKDSYGRVTGRVLADIRTASTTEPGIVQLNSATNSTSTTQAATPSAVKTAYDLADAAIPSIQKAANNGVATLGATGKIPKTQIELVASDVGAIALTEKAANNGVATLGGTGKIPKTQIELVASDVGAIASTEKAANNGVATLGETGKIPQSQLTIVGTTNRIDVNSTTNAIDLATVTQTDTNGTAGINFVQSIAKDSYGRVTGRVLADIRTASTTEPGIVQLNSATNSTSATQAATPSAVKTAYDLANAAIPSIQKAANNGVATLGATGKIPKTQIELVASDVGAIALTEKAANNGVATLGGTGKIPKTQIELVASDVGAIASTEKGSNNGVATLGADGLIPAAQIPKSISRSAIASTSITLGVEHNGLIVETTATEAVTLTLPNNLPAGFNCIVVQKGAGQITFTAASGAILRHPDNHSRSARQYSSCTLYVSTNTGNNAEYILAGNTGV